MYQNVSSQWHLIIIGWNWAWYRELSRQWFRKEWLWPYILWLENYLSASLSEREFCSAVRGSIIGGGHSYIRVLSDHFPFKSIVFKVCEQEYINKSLPPDYRSVYGSGVMQARMICGREI